MKTTLFTLLLLSSTLFAQTPPFELFCVSDLVKVFEDGYKLPERTNAIDIFGIRGEVLSAQMVIHAQADLRDVQVIVGSLSSTELRATIPLKNISYNFVRSIPLKVNTDIARGESLLRKAPASFPDYLSDERSTSLKKDQYQSIWLTIQIPKDALPGSYSGNIKVLTEQGSQSADIRLSVYPLTMPEKSNLYTTNWYQMNNKYHDFQKPFDEKFFKLIEVYAKNMAAHRQNVMRAELNAISATSDNNKNLRFDFSNYDRWVGIFEQTGGMSRIETGFIAHFETGDWEDTKIVLKDFDVKDEATGKVIQMKGESYLPQFLPAFEKHLKEKGWLEKTMFHISDEP
jgi:hypothetical protein